MDRRSLGAGVRLRARVWVGLGVRTQATIEMNHFLFSKVPDVEETRASTEEHHFFYFLRFPILGSLRHPFLLDLKTVFFWRRI